MERSGGGAVYRCPVTVGGHRNVRARRGPHEWLRGPRKPVMLRSAAAGERARSLSKGSPSVRWPSLRATALTGAHRHSPRRPPALRRHPLLPRPRMHPPSRPVNPSRQRSVGPWSRALWRTREQRSGATALASESMRSSRCTRETSSFTCRRRDGPGHGARGRSWGDPSADGRGTAPTAGLRGCSALSHLLAAVSTDPSGPSTLEAALGLWVQEGVRLMPRFVARLQNAYQAGIETVDFGAEDACTSINRWTAGHTGGRIGDLLARNRRPEYAPRAGERAPHERPRGSSPSDRRIPALRPSSMASTRRPWSSWTGSCVSVTLSFRGRSSSSFPTPPPDPRGVPGLLRGGPASRRWRDALKRRSRALRPPARDEHGRVFGPTAVSERDPRSRPLVARSGDTGARRRMLRCVRMTPQITLPMCGGRGAPVPFAPGSTRAQCTYCGARLVVDASSKTREAPRGLPQLPATTGLTPDARRILRISWCLRRARLAGAFRARAPARAPSSRPRRALDWWTRVVSPQWRSRPPRPFPRRRMSPTRTRARCCSTSTATGGRTRLACSSGSRRRSDSSVP